MIVREHGGGPTVVLVQGAEPIEDWFALSDVLSRRYRVLLPDLRTARGRAADELAAMLVERGATAPRALVGASTGAYLALELATRHGITPAVAIALAGVARMPGAADLRPRLPQLTARLYARVGALDRACPPGCIDEIARLAPRGTLEIVLGCGHDLLREDGPATVAAIAREIDRG
jgi:pimeloyl-ACP methyl ester carboxylesterase